MYKNICILLVTTSSIITADWRDDADFSLLQEYAGTSLPNGSGLSVSQTEAGNNYIPNVAHPSFSGIYEIINISNLNSTVSGHANNVGFRFYGSNLSLTPCINTVNIHSANDFLNNYLGSSSTVGSSTDAVMSHAYIFPAVGIVTTNNLLKRFDFFSQDSLITNVIGLNNGSGTSVPPGWGASYNSISVGRTNGNHSTGGTPNNFKSPGRLKPDIVVNETTTSWSTGAISSAASLLIDKGSQQMNSHTIHPDTIKASLMAGATKSEFSNWSQTTTIPLDTRFGAGEVNIFRSYRSIEENESTPGSVHHRGWTRDSVSASPPITKTYTFTTPATQNNPILSAALIWQRPVTETGTTYTYENLANLKLELLDSLGTVLQISDSLIDNVEHIWNNTLTPNSTYSLRVSSTSDSSHFSLAWTVTGENKINAIITSVLNANNLFLDDLIIGTIYQIQRSTNLKNWSTIQTFTATTTNENYTDTSIPTGDGVFYRLKFFHP